MSLAGSFLHEGVARAYRHRPPYPPALFDALERLIVDKPRHVLDLGAGEGSLARPLAARVDKVDAVEISLAMVDEGRRRPGGGHPHLVWHVQAAESLTLQGPYALATAGASLHWMDPGPTMSRLAAVLHPGAMLAIVDQNYHALPWADALTDIIVKHSRSTAYQPPSSLPERLAQQGLFEIHGRIQTPPTEFCQPVEDYIEQFHSTASLARELMPPTEAVVFGQAVRETVRGHATASGLLIFSTVTTVVWGRPVQAPQPAT